MPSSDSSLPLDWRAVARERQHGRVGRAIVYKPTLGSTNSQARDLLRAACLDGTVVVTDDQTHGRGRLGRRWSVPPMSGLTFSVALRLDRDAPLHSLTPAASLAVADVVQDVVGPRCTVKWPNDVLIDGAKVSGILVELDQSGDVWCAAIGIGINVNAAPDLPGATCLAAATGAALSRERLLANLLARLDLYLDMAAARPETLLRTWRDRLATVGLRVRVQTPGGVVEGVAEAVDAQGALLVRTDKGHIVALHAGDVTLAEAAPTP